MTAAAATDAQFGACTQQNFVDLETAMGELRQAEEELLACRTRAGAAMKDMLDLGALRKSVARLAGVSDQTVTNLALGRPKPKKGST